MIGLLVVLTALPGFFISLYFTLVLYRIVPADAPWVPRVCRMGSESCRLVLDHRDARVLGIPNSLPGLVYYGVVCIAAAAGFPALLQLPIRLASWAALALSVYLTYSLLLRVRVLCVLCLVSHALNLTLALLLVPGPG